MVPEVEESKVQTTVMDEEKTASSIPADKVELILMHDEGDPNTCEGAGIKIITSCGNGLLIWRFLIH